jgi:hypothetical protein
MDVFIRRGRAIDPSDESEGGRDRPPIDNSQNQSPVLDKIPLLEQVPDQAPKGAMTLPRPADGLSGESQQTTVNPVPSVDEAPSSAKLRWAVPIAGIGLLAQRGSWSRELDAAFDQADDRAWKRLRRAGRRREIGYRTGG